MHACVHERERAHVDACVYRWADPLHSNTHVPDAIAHEAVRVSSDEVQLRSRFLARRQADGAVALGRRQREVTIAGEEREILAGTREDGGAAARRADDGHVEAGLLVDDIPAVRHGDGEVAPRCVVPHLDVT